MTDIVHPELDLTHNRAPIYVQLSTLFRRFIVTGYWPVDRQIPTHETLAAQFDVNPATIRKAIALLEDEGLVARYRRHGTFVIAIPPATDWFEIATKWDAVVRSYRDLAFDVLDVRDADAAPKPFHAGGNPADGYRYLRRLYRRLGRPIIVEEAYLDQAVRRTFGDATLNRCHVLELLDNTKSIKILRADETIRFGTADAEISTILDIPLNASVAIIHLSVFGKANRHIFESCAYLRGDVAMVSEPMQFAKKSGR